MAWLSRAQERIGFSERWLREPSAAVLYTQRVSPPEHVHVVEENLALVERLGARTAALAVSLAAGTTKMTRTWTINSPRWIPETSSSSIPAAAGARNAGRRRITRRSSGNWQAPRHEQILLTGSPSEEPLIGGILQSAGAQRARYLPTTLVQFIALARRARLFIGGDTGPLHLAAAVGTPIVGIYGPTDPVRNGPFAADDIALSNRGPINHTRRGANPAYLPGISVGVGGGRRGRTSGEGAWIAPTLRWAARWRVPLGFLLGVAYLVFCRPTVKLLIAGGAVAAAGVAVRAYAAGHLAKNQSLAMSGPYAYTRNPLYLGSALMGAGFAVAGGWKQSGGSWRWPVWFCSRRSIGRSSAARRNTCAASSERFTIVTPSVFPFSSRAFAGLRAVRSFSGSNTGRIMSTKPFWATLP